ncbi:proline-, glutamic acid- and leucine-rich protein 1-like isoform X9 [Zingiber officinale]|uniref:proline-, glutamic acid- and leucine-rich protein 1-like isoform X9 n=1 Tax=Zingiber officinale TaxID=94328 RepID=UPI001C4C284E|nr:proline-, glutamic acid- and leucine-rich protein 1-like isoform X9 [Zingiber officinale]
MVRYDIPNSFLTEMPPPTGWEDENDEAATISEAVFPNIWEDTPWEDDPEFELEDLPTPPREEYFQENEEEEDDDRETYFLGLENLENEYPSLSPTTVLQQPRWDDEDEVSDEYWQNIVEQVGRIEEHYEAEQAMTNEVRGLSIHEETTSQEGNEPNEWLPYAGQNNEAAHMGTDSIMEQLETLDYPILRSMATNENVLASSSAISRYNPPQEPLMGQVNYPPGQIENRTIQVEAPAINGRFRPRGINHQPWALPSAQTNDGAILILPEDIDKVHR